VKCKRCSKYHAVIPSFSLPGTSLGTAEVEDFVKKRKLNQSRKEAGAQLLEKGISFKHLKNIEKMFDRSQLYMKAIFPDMVDDYSKGIDRCLNPEKKEQPENLIYFLNHFCLSRNVNAVFCNRLNILLFNTAKAGTLNSINLGFASTPSHAIDSS
jgi:hypothetical protein